MKRVNNFNKKKNTVILGIGNILLKDDGIGVKLINLLKESNNLPSDFKFIDCGTSVFETLGFFLDYDRVIIIDALKGGKKPGTLFKIKPEDINDYQRENLSIHDVQILDVINMAMLFDKIPEVIIFGIEPYEIDYGLELSSLIKSKLTNLKNVIEKELAALPA